MPSRTLMWSLPGFALVLAPCGRCVECHRGAGFDIMEASCCEA